MPPPWQNVNRHFQPPPPWKQTREARAVFVHVPKTGGTYFQNRNERAGFPVLSWHYWKHAALNGTKPRPGAYDKRHHMNGRLLDTETAYCNRWHRPLKAPLANTFCFVRNPYSRIISQYRYHVAASLKFNKTRRSLLRPYSDTCRSFRRWLRLSLESYLGLCLTAMNSSLPAVVAPRVRRLLSEPLFVDARERKGQIWPWDPQPCDPHRAHRLLFDCHLLPQWTFAKHVAKIFRVEDGLGAALPHIRTRSYDLSGLKLTAQPRRRRARRRMERATALHIAGATATATAMALPNYNASGNSQDDGEVSEECFDAPDTRDGVPLLKLFHVVARDDFVELGKRLLNVSYVMRNEGPPASDRDRRPESEQ